jgi:dTDP-4-dehydrorhamnose 3,5-epimerase
VLDVAVDIRSTSPTFGQHVSVKLSGVNKKQLFVPRGFAHGFVVLSDTAVFSYKVDNYFSPENDRGIDASDSNLNIDWLVPFDDRIISEKDSDLPGFSELISPF